MWSWRWEDRRYSCSTNLILKVQQGGLIHAKQGSYRTPFINRSWQIAHSSRIKSINYHNRTVSWPPNFKFNRFSPFENAGKYQQKPQRRSAWFYATTRATKGTNLQRTSQKPQWWTVIEANSYMWWEVDLFEQRRQKRQWLGPKKPAQPVPRRDRFIRFSFIAARQHKTTHSSCY